MKHQIGERYHDMHRITCDTFCPMCGHAGIKNNGKGYHRCKKCKHEFFIAGLTTFE